MTSFRLYIVERYYYRVEIYGSQKEMHERLRFLYSIFPYRTEKLRKKDQEELETHKAVTLWSEGVDGKNSLGLMVFCKQKLDLYYVAHEIQHALIFAAKKINVDLKMLGRRIGDDENMAYAAGRVLQKFFIEVFKRRVIKIHGFKGKSVSR